MSRTLADVVYERLPVSLQNAVCSLYGYKEKRVRLGAVFREALASLEQSDRYDHAAIEALQNERVRELVRHAYDHVPYYRERWSESGLRPADIRTVADLARLPIVTKEDVRRNAPKLLATNAVKSELVARHTSGTTAKALDFYTSRQGIAFQWAVWWRYRARFGFRPGDEHLNFTGKIVVPATQRNPPYWRRNAPMHQYLTAMQHMTREHVPDIVALIDARKLDVLTGYPSVVHAFVLAAMDAGLRLRHVPRLVTTGAENLLDDQRRDIAAFMPGVVLSDQYGLSEGCGNMSQCEQFRYHEDFEFGVVELVDPERRPDGTTAAKIVCTGFANPEFPFIRYDTGDVAVLTDESCGCGRASKTVRRIEGRIDDYVVTPEGRRIMRFDYVFKETAAIREAQVVQRKLGEVVIRVVRRPGYSAAVEDSVTSEIHRWISPALAVRFEYVDAIERQPNGKFRAVKSELRESATMQQER